MNDALGDRQKECEMAEAGRRLLYLLPAMIRLDGKCFSKLTRNLERPYDPRLSMVMIDLTKQLVQETNACCGYTQSDEISLVLYSSSYHSQIYFDGRIQKICSVLAAECSVRFNSLCYCHNLIFDGSQEWGPVFDCRVWNVPTLEEAANAFLWRELDATKNAISMAVQEHYSHKELMNKNSSDKQELLFQKGVNFNDYPNYFKRGSFIQRRVVKNKLSPEDLEKLPPLHNARKNPDLEIERAEYRRLLMPPFSKVLNRVGVIFRGEEPRVEGEGFPIS